MAGDDISSVFVRSQSKYSIPVWIHRHFPLNSTRFSSHRQAQLEERERYSMIIHMERILLEEFHRAELKLFCIRVNDM